MMEVDAVGSWLRNLPEPYRDRNYLLFLLASDFSTHMSMWPFTTRLYHKVYIMTILGGRSSAVKI